MIIQSFSTLRTSTDHLSFRPLASYLYRTIIQATNDVIPLTGITEIEWAKHIQLYHIVWMLHDKPFVPSYLCLTLGDIQAMSL